MIEPGVLALIGSGIAVGVALVALVRTVVLELRLNRELEEAKQARAQIDRALGREEGAAQERLIAAQARMDRATAAALVLNPEPPAPTGPTEVVIVGQAEPVPVRIAVHPEAQSNAILSAIADRAAEAAAEKDEPE